MQRDEKMRGDDERSIDSPNHADRKPPQDLSQRTHRVLIGVLGMLLPVAVYLLAGLRPTNNVVEWKLLPSISAYYHTGAVAAFVGVLFALSLFLFTYRGYLGVATDRIVGAIGGAAAMGVALFPTRAPEGVANPQWWQDWMNDVHYVAACVFFIALILFAVWLFRKSDIPRRSDRPRAKRIRDDICLVCGVVMMLSIAWAVVALRSDQSIFWPESVAVVAFGVSWLVKSQIYEPMLERML